MEASGVYSTPVSPRGDSGLVPAKIGSMVVLGGCALVASLLPVLLARRCSTNPRFLDYLLRFGGGVLLATTFLHLLPEVREGLEDAEKEGGWVWDFPVQLPELLMCLGFFLMYAIEEVAHKLLGHHHHHDPEKASLHNQEEDPKNTWSSGTPLRAILITLAISVHQVFEGLAVGLETHTGQVWILTGAIAAHKVVIAICIGAEASTSPPWSIAALIASFSIATPLGIGLGLILSSDSSLGATPVFLQGLAAGTLLFVVFFEVLQRSKNGPQLGHLFITAVGFGLMFILLCFFQS